ncbi:hypothetical protein ACIRQP_18545 [Streptomyces sp. NPDC102274]
MVTTCGTWAGWGVISIERDGAPANWNRTPTQWGTDLPNWA